MRMELYNTTDKTKVIPKFNYEGKMTMKPHGKEEIEDYMAGFYKPYSKIGIVVRPIAKMGTFSLKKEESIEPEVEEIIKEVPKAVVIEEPVKEVEIVEEESPILTAPVEQEEEIEDEVEEMLNEVVGDTVEEKTEEKPSRTYTKSELSTLSIKGLRDVVKSLGLDIKSNKKAELIKAILDSQK